TESGYRIVFERYIANSNDPLEVFVYGLFCYASGRRLEAERIARDSEVAPDWRMELLRALVWAHGGDWREAQLSTIRMHACVPHGTDGSSYTFPSVFAGLVSFICGRNGDWRSEGEIEKGIPHSDGLQKSLSSLNEARFDQGDSAISSLIFAKVSRSPILLWLHLWPVFDEIRHHEVLQSLVEEIGLNSGASE